MNNCMSRVMVILLCLWFLPVWGHHDEPGSFREFELREQLTELELNLAELLYQLTYVPVKVRPHIYQEIQDVRDKLSETITQLIEEDQQEHPQP